jgi:hypothetical protein
LEDNSTAFCVAFQGMDDHRMGLYVHSYLGLGATEAQETLRDALVADCGGGAKNAFFAPVYTQNTITLPRQARDKHRENSNKGRVFHSSAGDVDDACLLEGYTTTVEAGNGATVTFNGHGDHAACSAAIVTHVLQTQATCDWKHCAFDGVYQPTLTAGDLHLKKEFFELSAFAYTVRIRPVGSTPLEFHDRCRHVVIMQWRCVAERRRIAPRSPARGARSREREREHEIKHTKAQSSVRCWRACMFQMATECVAPVWLCMDWLRLSSSS